MDFSSNREKIFKDALFVDGNEADLDACEDEETLMEKVHSQSLRTII